VPLRDRPWADVSTSESDDEVSDSDDNMRHGRGTGEAIADGRLGERPENFFRVHCSASSVSRGRISDREKAFPLLALPFLGTQLVAGHCRSAEKRRVG